MSEQPKQQQSKSDRTYTKAYRLYKPRKSGGGCASSWEPDNERESLWLEMATQVGQMSGDENAQFDWKSKLRMKLGVVDIGEIIAVLERRQRGVGSLRSDGSGHRGFYHKNPNGSTTLAFDEAKEGAGWFLKIGVQKAGSKEVQSLSHSVSLGEGTSLLVLLRFLIERMYRW